MLLRCTALFCILASVTADCPSIVSRSEWNANAPKSKVPLKVPVNFVVIHHTVDPDHCSTRSTCSNAVRSIQKYHQQNKKWLDIGYNFLVGGDGSIYEGRGWKSIGTHAPNYNSRSIGIAFIGDFTNKAPPQNMVDAAQNLLRCGVEGQYIGQDYKLFGHRQVTKTECPGNTFYPLLKNWPHYSPST